MKNKFDTPEILKIIQAGHLAACRELDDIPRHLLDEGNPNNPMYDNTIFGYNEVEFLKKQYKI